MDIEEFVAGKPFTLAGVKYQPGDIVEVSNLPDHKVKQFLRQRLLKPYSAPAQGATTE